MIAKLPKWAQAHIKDLDRRAFVSERTLREYHDNSTPSEFFTEDYDTDRQKMVRRYVQTHKMEILRNGLRITIINRQDDPGVDITWCDEERSTYQVPCIPQGLNHVRIVLKKDLR